MRQARRHFPVDLLFYQEMFEQFLTAALCLDDSMAETLKLTQRELTTPERMLDIGNATK